MLSPEAAGCGSAMIVPSLASPLGTTVEADELETGAAISEFDAAPEPHRLSDAYDVLGHALTFSRLATSRVVPFESITSRASTAFGSGPSTFASGAAVATVGVCTGANANALRGSESVSATMRAIPLVPAISPKPRKARVADEGAAAPKDHVFQLTGPTTSSRRPPLLVLRRKLARAAMRKPRHEALSTSEYESAY